MSITPELYEFIIKVVEDKVKEIKVTREEFDKLTKAVKELAQAQRRTEERLNRLAERVEQLAEAQRRTEERLNRLAERVEQLAEAQRRTEERLNQLAARVDQLTEAVHSLSVSVGRLSDVVGYGLEDIARVMVPGWLERHMSIYVEDLSPRFIEVNGSEIQLNLFGIGRKDGAEVVIVGECKSRIYASEVKKFSAVLEKVRKAFPNKEILGFIFGFLIHPSAEAEAKKLGVKVIATYMR